MDNHISSATSTATNESNGHCLTRTCTESSQSNGIQKVANSSTSSASSSSSSSLAKASFLSSLYSLFAISQKMRPKASTSPSSNGTSCAVPKSTSMLTSIGTVLSRSKFYMSSLRAKSLTTSLIPVLLGTLLAAKVTGQFSFVTLLATVLTVLSVHAAGNLVNTYHDFVRGIDSKDRKSDDRTLVDSILTKEEVVNLGGFFYLIGILGFLITVLVSPARIELLALMYFGGISSSFLYTGGIGLKYIALGDLIIMITFGPVSVLYSFIAQTGTIRLVTLLYAIPLALNAEAILHSNNTRDIEDDRKAGCVTIAVLIGPSASHFLFAMLLFVPYILFMVGALHYSPWLLLPLITLPRAFKMEKLFRDGNLRYLPKQMVRLNFYFGMFYLLACLLANPHNLPGLFQF